jgi:hypothetical protein
MRYEEPAKAEGIRPETFIWPAPRTDPRVNRHHSGSVGMYAEGGLLDCAGWPWRAGRMDRRASSVPAVGTFSDGRDCLHYYCGYSYICGQILSDGTLSCHLGTKKRGSGRMRPAHSP